MTGKIIIYGGTGGIGLELARSLRSRGFDLHLVARDKTKLTSAASELDATYSVGDVLDDSLFANVTEAVGEDVAGLAYAVGTINLKPLQRLSEEDFLNDYRVNAVGAARAVQAALPALKKCSTTASVLLFSSVAASQGFTFHSSIGMAKGAISGLTLSLASELAPKVRVNAIAPSLTRTPLAHKLLNNEKVADQIAKMHALPRLGEATDIAEVGAFLMSKEAGWMTGQIVGVDGGRSTLR